MSRVYADLKDGDGRRYWYDLSNPGGVLSPVPATLTIGSLEVVYPAIAFREPAHATLNFIGVQVGPEFKLQPATAALSIANSAVGLVTSLTISPSLESPVESPPNDFVPTILFINTITPTTATLTLIGYDHSLDQGGNIAFRSPVTAALTLEGRQWFRVVPPAEAANGNAIMSGLAPSLATTLIIEPAVGLLYIPETIRVTVDKAFVWVDEDPAPALAWG